MTEPQNQDIVTNTSVEYILSTVSDKKAINTCTVKEKDVAQKSSTTVQQEKIDDIIKEDESKSLHNK